MPRDPESQRAAKRRWYENNRDVYRDRNRKKRQETRDYLRELKSVPCMDCRVQYPYWVMEFDHREGEVKVGNPSSDYTGWGRAKLDEELKKCDVVCANCHATRTHLRRLKSRQVE